MTQSNRLGSMALAIFAGIIGLLLALTSLAHNIEGVLPRISAVPGTFEYFIQMIMEGGATVGLNMVALFGFTFATLMFAHKNFGKAAGLVLVAILAMLWSGTTQLGVIAEKTFSVSGSKENSMRLYQKALKEEQEINDAMPSSHQYLGTANAELTQAKAALKSHKYGKRTAWQTTNECTADITKAKSLELCRRYALAVKSVENSKYAADLDRRRVAVNKILQKGPPTTIDAGPELVASATGGLLSIKNVQVILVFLRSFGIDLAAGLCLATALSIWPAKAYRASDAHTASALFGASVAHQQPRQPDGGLGVQSDEPVQNDGPNKGVQTIEKTKAVIEHMKAGVQGVQNTEHSSSASDAHKASAENSVFKALQTLSIDGEFKTSYRAISDLTKAIGGHSVATGAMNEVLESLTARGLIERDSSKGKGTCGRVLNTEHAYA